MLKGRFERFLVRGLLWIVIVFLLTIGVFMAGAAWEVREKQKLAWVEREHARQKFESVKERHGALTANIEHLSSDRGREEEFRKRFLVAKEGEEVIILVDAPEPVSEAAAEASKGIWATVREWFGF